MDTSIKCKPGEGRTKQSFKDECDINKIMNRYVKTGQLPAMQRKNPQYGDFSSALDFQAAQDIVVKAREQFEALPAKVRSRFKNEPSEFLRFMEDPENVKEMESLGLINKKEEVKEVNKPEEKKPDDTSGGAENVNK